MCYAVIVVGKEARSSSPGNPIVSKEGTRFWVIRDLDDYVDASSRAFTDDSTVPDHVMIFPTKTKAEHFAKRWKGFPWWCRPNGTYEIIKLKPNYVRVVKGYVRA